MTAITRSELDELLHLAVKAANADDAARDKYEATKANYRVARHNYDVAEHEFHLATRAAAVLDRERANEQSALELLKAEETR